jgi:dTDP-4-dehydrorhamnose reductase
MKGRTLIFGAGWMGAQFARRIEGARLVSVDIADEQAVQDALDAHKPERVLNCAGRTGRPNVDSLEAEPARTYRSNVAGAILLAGACAERGLHFTHLGSGCVYSGDKDGAGFREEDPPNFHGSLYSRTKALAEAALRDIGALQLRIRLPLSSEPGPRNLLTKLLQFEEVVRVANSVTILDDFWEPACALMAQGAVGVWNCVNPGIEYHDELLTMWQERVDPSHAFGIIDPSTLSRRLAAGRSNCILDATKLREAGLAMPELSESLPRVIDAYARRREAAAGDL